MEFVKLNRTKVFRDPLYGYIEVDYKLISDLIDSEELQRLRRIRQLSGVSMVFQTAEHSRFTHALGAYHMANLVLRNVEGIEVLSKYEQIVFLCAALLHDIGHGPYSHAFENVLSTSHEEMTVKMILNKNTHVNRILLAYPGLDEDIASVISHKGKFPLIETFVSSQLDVDRMDFLSRDAYFTGATYGTIDMNRILRSMKVVNGELLCRASGVHSIESYLMSRYHMYFQVYYHPVSRSYELLLESIYERIKDLVDSNIDIDANIQSFINVIKDNNDVESYIEIDDAYVNGFIKQLMKSNDPVLSMLANRFSNRHLFKYIDLVNEPNMERVNKIKENAKNHEFGKYLCYQISVSGVAYLSGEDKENKIIKILLPSGEVRDIEQYSNVINGLTSSSYKKIDRLYYSGELDE